jgi:hypothetical protein
MTRAPAPLLPHPSPRTAARLRRRRRAAGAAAAAMRRRPAFLPSLPRSDAAEARFPTLPAPQRCGGGPLSYPPCPAAMRAQCHSLAKSRQVLPTCRPLGPLGRPGPSPGIDLRPILNVGTAATGWPTRIRVQVTMRIAAALLQALGRLGRGMCSRGTAGGHPAGGRARAAAAQRTAGAAGLRVRRGAAVLRQRCIPFTAVHNPPNASTPPQPNPGMTPRPPRAIAAA